MLKVGAVLEFLIAGIHFGARQCAEPVHAEFLAAEAPHHGTVNHSPAQVRVGYLSVSRIDALARQITDKAAREAIPGAGRVEDFLQQIAWDHEMAVLPK